MTLDLIYIDNYKPIFISYDYSVTSCHVYAMNPNNRQWTTKSLLETLLNIILDMSEGCGVVDQWYIAGLSLYRKKLYQEAIKCFDRSLDLSSLKGFNSWFMKGNSLYQLNDFREAIKCFDNSMS